MRHSAPLNTESNMNMDENHESRKRDNDASDEAVRKLRLAARAMSIINREQTSASHDDEIMPISQMPRDRRDAAFDIIRECRSASRQKALQGASEADYAKKFSQIKATLAEDYVENELDRWLLPLAKYVQVGNSYKAYKAAICWGLRRQIKEDLALQDRMQRDGFDALVWEGVVRRLQRTTSLLEEIEATTRVSTYWGGLKQRSQRKRSKKEDLIVLEQKQPLWLLRFLLAMRRTRYLEEVLLLLLCGCRAEELMKGVRIEWDGHGGFTMHVKGAKVTETSGQPWRLFSFNAEALPRSWAKRLKEHGSMDVQVSCKDALRRSMTDISKRVLPGLPYVTASVFRNLISSRLREDDSRGPGLSESLGHLVSETKAYYGFKPKRGGLRRSTKRLPIGVSVPREVRPPGREGLERVLQNKDLIGEIWKP